MARVTSGRALLMMECMPPSIKVMKLEEYNGKRFFGYGSESVWGFG